MRVVCPLQTHGRRWLAVALLALVAGCGGADPLDEVRDLQNRGLFRESLEPARAVVEAHPDDPEAAYRYGLALVRSGWASLSHFALRKAMESPEWIVPAGLEIARSELATGNAEEAIAVATRVLEADPEHLDALFVRTHARIAARAQYEEAIADADRLVELDPGNVEAMMLRVVSLLGLKRLEEAETGLAEIDRIAKDAEDETLVAGLCAMRSVLELEKGEIQAAEALFQACLEAHPTDIDVVTQAVEFYDKRNQPERALEILRKVLDEEPSASVIRDVLAERLRQRGETAEAERLLREGTELASPDRALAAWVALANHFHALENHEEAANALGRAVEVAGRRADPQMRFDYADSLVMAGRYDEALALAREIEVPALHALVEGRVALEQERPADALVHFGEALNLWPDSAVARYYAARAAEAAGDFNRAVEEYRYSIRIDPTLTDARVRLALLHEAAGNDEQALVPLRHDAGRKPPGVEAELVALRLLSRLGRDQALQRGLEKFAAQPALRGRAVAEVARGLRDRAGPAQAARFIRSAARLDLTHPVNTAALRELVVCLAEIGEGAQAVEITRRALERHPGWPAFHSIHAAALRASGAPVDDVRGAYARAVELDPDGSADALAGLARIAQEGGDEAAALDLYARAAAADPDALDPLRDAARLLIAQGRRPEAEQRLVAALRRRPTDSASASLLAQLLLERDADSDRTLALAKTAVRFGEGPETYALLAKVYSSRNETELASAALARSHREATEPVPRP